MLSQTSSIQFSVLSDSATTPDNRISFSGEPAATAARTIPEPDPQQRQQQQQPAATESHSSAPAAPLPPLERAPAPNSRGASTRQHSEGLRDDSGANSASSRFLSAVLALDQQDDGDKEPHDTGAEQNTYKTVFTKGRDSSGLRQSSTVVDVPGAISHSHRRHRSTHGESGRESSSTSVEFFSASRSSGPTSSSDEMRGRAPSEHTPGIVHTNTRSPPRRVNAYHDVDETPLNTSPHASRAAAADIIQVIDAADLDIPQCPVVDVEPPSYRPVAIQHASARNPSSPSNRPPISGQPSDVFPAGSVFRSMGMPSDAGAGGSSFRDRANLSLKDDGAPIIPIPSFLKAAQPVFHTRWPSNSLTDMRLSHSTMDEHALLEMQRQQAAALLRSDRVVEDQVRVVDPSTPNTIDERQLHLGTMAVDERPVPSPSPTRPATHTPRTPATAEGADAQTRPTGIPLTVVREQPVSSPAMAIKGDSGSRSLSWDRGRRSSAVDAPAASTPPGPKSPAKKRAKSASVWSRIKNFLSGGGCTNGHAQVAPRASSKDPTPPPLPADKSRLAQHYLRQRGVEAPARQGVEAGSSVDGPSSLPQTDQTRPFTSADSSAAQPPSPLRIPPVAEDKSPTGTAEAVGALRRSNGSGNLSYEEYMGDDQPGSSPSPHLYRNSGAPDSGGPPPDDLDLELNLRSSSASETCREVSNMLSRFGVAHSTPAQGDATVAAGAPLAPPRGRRASRRRNGRPSIGGSSRGDSEEMVAGLRTSGESRPSMQSSSSQQQRRDTLAKTEDDVVGELGEAAPPAASTVAAEVLDGSSEPPSPHPRGSCHTSRSRSHGRQASVTERTKRELLERQRNLRESSRVRAKVNNFQALPARRRPGELLLLDRKEQLLTKELKQLDQRITEMQRRQASSSTASAEGEETAHDACFTPRSASAEVGDAPMKRAGRRRSEANRRTAPSAPPVLFASYVPTMANLRPHTEHAMTRLHSSAPVKSSNTSSSPFNVSQYYMALRKLSNTSGASRGVSGERSSSRGRAQGWMATSTTLPRDAVMAHTFLHVHRDAPEMARFLDALREEYYHHCSPANRAITSNTPSEAGSRREDGTSYRLRPSCAACTPQSADEYAVLALLSLADNLHDQQQGSQVTPNAASHAAHSSVPRVAQPFRSEFYASAPPSKKATQADSSSAVSVPGASASSSDPLLVSTPPPTLRHAHYARLPFTPSAESVKAFRELWDAAVAADERAAKEAAAARAAAKEAATREAAFREAAAQAAAEREAAEEELAAREAEEREAALKEAQAASEREAANEKTQHVSEIEAPAEEPAIATVQDTVEEKRQEDPFAPDSPFSAPASRSPSTDVQSSPPPHDSPTEPSHASTSDNDGADEASSEVQTPHSSSPIKEEIAPRDPSLFAATTSHSDSEEGKADLHSFDAAMRGYAAADAQRYEATSPSLVRESSHSLEATESPVVKFSSATSELEHPIDVEQPSSSPVRLPGTTSVVGSPADASSSISSCDASAIHPESSPVESRSGGSSRSPSSHHSDPFATVDDEDEQHNMQENEERSARWEPSLQFEQEEEAMASPPPEVLRSIPAESPLYDAATTHDLPSMLPPAPQLTTSPGRTPRPVESSSIASPDSPSERSPSHSPRLRSAATPLLPQRSETSPGAENAQLLSADTSGLPPAAIPPPLPPPPANTPRWGERFSPAPPLPLIDDLTPRAPCPTTALVGLVEELEGLDAILLRKLPQFFCGNDASESRLAAIRRRGLSHAFDPPALPQESLGARLRRKYDTPASAEEVSSTSLTV